MNNTAPAYASEGELKRRLLPGSIETLKAAARLKPLSTKDEGQARLSHRHSALIGSD